VELLAHGELGGPPHPVDPLDPYADYTVEDLYAFLREYRPKGPPPHSWDYSNLGVGLLGHILERVYGRSYADLVMDKISRPLGLPDTLKKGSACALSGGMG